jgi:SAM-dependent methyltransferase
MRAAGFEEWMTMNGPVTTSAEFFEEKYKRDADPWAFASSGYEQERYRTIVRALDGRRYGRAFEPGCSVGVLTEMLAEICDSVEAIDLSETAVQRAQERCGALNHVKIRVGALPEALPAGKLDLVVLSEIGYYFQASAWSAVVDRVMSLLQPGATLVAAHWLGRSKDHRMNGDMVHALLRARTGLRLEYGSRYERSGPEAGFRLDRWVRV